MGSLKCLFYLCLIITAMTQANPAPAAVEDFTVEVSVKQLNIAPRNSGSVTCIPGGSPLPRVVWRKHGGELGKGTKQVGNTLVISDAVRSDTGYYICLGVVDRKTVTQQYVLVEVKDDEQSRPKVRVSERIVKIGRGQNGTVDCIPEGYPLPRVQWGKGEAALIDNARQEGNSLIITNADDEDAGDYVCHALVELTSVWSDYARVQIEDVEQTTPNVGHPKVKISVKQLKIPRGGSSTVDCIPEGYPLPSVQWAKTEGRIGTGSGQSGNKLIISNAQDSDAGHYVCSAIVEGTAVWTDYLSVEIEDVQTETSPRVQVSVTQLQIPAGQNGIVDCTPQGSPLPRIQWSKEAGQFSSRVRPNGNRLVITNAQHSDGGNYACNGLVDSTTVWTDYLQIEVVNPVVPTRLRDQLPKPIDMSFVEGQDIRISCDFETGDDQQTVTWSRLDQRPLPQNAQQNGRELIFQRATKEDAGEYLCKVPGGRLLLRQLYVRLTVLSQVRVAIRPEIPSVLRGQDLTMECVVVSGDDVHVTWDRIGGAFSSRVENRGAQLIFRSIESEDGGYYRCVVQNSAGEISQTTQIVVTDPPPPPPQSNSRVTVIVRELKLRRGQTGTAVCNPEGSPLPTVQWSKKGEGGFSNGVRQAGNALTISDAQDYDTGDYVCTGIVQSTPVSTDYLRVIVEDEPTPPLAQSSPRVAVSQRQLKLRRGESATVDCNPEGSPLPAVQWTKGNGEFSNGVTQAGNTLTISNAQDYESGDYVCSAMVELTPVFSDYLQIIVEDEITTTPPPQSNPRVAVSVRQLTIRRGESGTVDCIPEGSPLPAVQWTKDGNGAFSSGVTQAGNALTISNAQEYDSGDYLCSAMVESTPVFTDYLQIIVEEPSNQDIKSPRVKVSESQLEIEEGDSRTIECTPEGSPLPRVVWNKEDSQFSSSTRQDGNALVITEAQESDTGYYICRGDVEGTPVFSDYLNVQVTAKAESSNDIDKSICKLSKAATWCLLGSWYYYDASEHQCKFYGLGQCGANENNFETEEACNEACSGV